MPTDLEIIKKLEKKLGFEIEEIGGASRSDAQTYDVDDNKNVVGLYLDNAGLSELPPEIAQLKNLTALWLNANRLSELPPEIVQLKYLNRLNLNINRLSELPPEIVQLKNLSLLWVKNNYLSKLPPEIAQLQNLRDLELDGNPLKQPPPEIAEQGVAAIFEYMRQLPDKPAATHNEAKLILVGQGDVGKTCLAERLMFDTFQEQKSTEGIDICEWEIDTPAVDGEKIKLNVWDFGGQEIYHSTHQFFLTKRSVYLLVWNARKSKDHEHIYYWLHTIEAFGGDSPVILVMTKWGERDDDLNMKDFREKFPQIVGAFKVENEDGKGVEDLKKYVSTAAWELPHMRTSWVDAWYKVRERLENDERNWLDQKKFRQICKEEGLDKKQTDILDAYLHDLGVIIHFTDKVGLRNMVILDPEWATRAVYKVLDAPSVRERDGVLLHSELDEIWDPADYSEELYPNLLELMNTFELAYELPDGESQLVAELLPSTEPEFDWDDSDNLRFYYSYDFLPAGVITRFIVRMHSFVESIEDGKHLCWREGAVLKWRGARAFVRVRKVEKLIEIRIHGKKKRELLAAIRMQFDHINRSIRKVKITQEIPCSCEGDCPNRFDYEKLLEAEQRGKSTIECQEGSWKDVDLSSLLDGYQQKRERQKEFAEKVATGPVITIEGDAAISFGRGHSSLKKEVKTVGKEQMINVGDGAQISGSVVIAESIQNSFNTLKEADIDSEVKKLLDQLLREINELGKKIPEEKADEAKAMTRDADTLVGEVASAKPRPKWYKMSLDGIKDAAAAVGAIATPIIGIAEKLAQALTPPL